MIVTGLQAKRSRRRGGAGRASSAGQFQANINVTPLVDVVLVLLIIFMVVTPMLSKGVNVDLPVTQHHDKRNDDNRDIVVAITHRGEIYVGSDRVALDSVGNAVVTERRRHPDKTIFLKGDARLDFVAARGVIESLHRAGVTEVQLGTEEERQSESRP